MKSHGTHDSRIDNLRAFAILTVVLGHSMILYSSDWNLYQTGQQSLFFDICKRIINLYQMPLFLSLAGYLYARTAERDSFKRLLAKKLPRLLIPFFAVGLLYMIPIKLLAGYPPYRGEPVYRPVLQFLSGKDTGHLWYLPVLLAMFILSHLIVRLFGNRKLVWGLTFGVGLLLALLRKRLPLGGIPYASDFAAFSWSFYYGALLFHEKNIWEKASGKWIRLAAAACALAGVFLALRFRMEPLRVFAGLMILLALYMFVPDRSVPAAAALSNASFGLYLLHSPLIYLSFAVLLDAPPVVVFGVNAILWGALAFLATRLLSRTPLRLLIGG